MYSRISSISSLEWKFGLHYLLSRAWFLGNFWLIYLLSKGYDLQDAAIMDIVFWTSLLLFEIPTGYIADRFGRKTSLFLSFITQTLGVTLFAIGSSLLVFLVSYAVWAVGMTMQSGAEEAWLYDEITYQMGNDSSYQRIFGNMLSVGMVSSAIAGYSSGFLAELELVYTIYATTIIFGLASVWILVIPHSKQTDSEENPPRLREAFMAIGTREVIFLALLQITVFAVLLTISFWFQTFLDSNDISYLSIAFILSTSSVIMALGSKFNESIQGMIGYTAPYLLPILSGIVILFMAVNIGLAITGYWLIAMIRGIWGPIISKQVNKRIETRVRATALSIISAISTIAIMGTEYFTSKYIQQSGYNQFFILMGVITIVIITLLFFIRKRYDPSVYGETIPIHAIS